MSSKNKITVLVIDNHPTTLAGICLMLSQTCDIEVIGEAQSGDDLYSLVKRLKPNIILLDTAISGSKPSELIKWVCENHPDTKTLIFSSDNEDENLAAMIDAGISGYINKEETEASLIKAIRQTANGAVFFSNEQYARVKNWKELVGEKINQLTRRETEILKLLAKGYDNQKISVSLDISTKTAAYHVSGVLSKLHVKSRQEATIWALKHLSDNME